MCVEVQVRQQLDSFDQFITNELQEIVSASPTMAISAQKSYHPGVKSSDVSLIHVLRWGTCGACERKQA